MVEKKLDTQALKLLEGLKVNNAEKELLKAALLALQRSDSVWETIVRIHGFAYASLLQVIWTHGHYELPQLVGLSKEAKAHRHAIAVIEDGLGMEMTRSTIQGMVLAIPKGAKVATEVVAEAVDGATVARVKKVIKNMNHKLVVDKARSVIAENRINKLKQLRYALYY